MDLPRKNDLLELTITGTAHDGAGVGRHEGYVLFVPRTAVGDVALVRVTKVLKGYGYARLERLLTPSPDRIEPACPVADRCGGCCFHHIGYQAELRAKQAQVEAALSKALGELPPVAPIAGSPQQLRYRNKVQLPVGLRDGRAVTGFYRPHSHDIVPCEDCLLQPPAATAAARVLREHIDRYQLPVYDERSHSGLVRGLFVRTGAATGQVMAVAVLNGDQLPHAQQLVEAMRESVPGLVSLQVNINRDRTNVVLGQRTLPLWGEEAIEDVLLGNRYRISAASFYQINHAQCERLYRSAIELAQLDGTQRLLDLYCGIGTIGLSMAGSCREVVGVELHPAAVRDAVEAAARNGIANARFLCADAAQAAQQLAAEGFAPDVVVVDPPRKGCDEALLQTVAAMAPQRLLYVSCNPATLARDAARLRQLGYELREARPFDMFPRTPHVETVVLLSRKTPNDVIHVDLELDELDVTAAEAKATYQEIKDYVLNKFGLKVSQLYIVQVKLKHGIIERENYNKPKSEDAKVPQCPPEKEKAIEDALRHFEMI